MASGTTGSSVSRAVEMLQAEFGSLGTLDKTGDGFEFSVPAPNGSHAGHLVAFSNGSDLWIRFSPPHACYPVADADEMISLVRRLTNDQIGFKIAMDSGKWTETTLISLPADSVGKNSRVVSWSGRFDRSVDNL